MSIFSAVHPLRRRHNFTDDGGVESYTAREDEIRGWSHDWTDELASGETVSSAAYVDSGVTRSSVTLATPITSCNVTGLGEFEVTVTLSTGRSLQKIVRFYADDGHRSEDYT